jgi:cytochrome c oxidase subunit 1
VFSSIGSSILAVTYLLPFLYLIYSLRYGAAAPPNPWGATGLEWTVPSPPPKHNFAETPVVTEDPYNYPLERKDADD